jgi:hypothetical protein
VTLSPLLIRCRGWPFLSPPAFEHRSYWSISPSEAFETFAITNHLLEFVSGSTLFRVQGNSSEAVCVGNSQSDTKAGAICAVDD